jgi:hypothetical protein
MIIWNVVGFWDLNQFENKLEKENPLKFPWYRLEGGGWIDDSKI